MDKDIQAKVQIPLHDLILLSNTGCIDPLKADLFYEMICFRHEHVKKQNTIYA